MWTPVGPSDGEFPVQHGAHYRVDASVKSSISAAAMANYLSGKGWSNIVMYDEALGQQPPPDWPPSSPISPAGERMIHGEADHTGSDGTVPQTEPMVASIFGVHFHVQRVWKLSPDALGTTPGPGTQPGTGPAPSPVPASSPQSSKSNPADTKHLALLAIALGEVLLGTKRF